jgi:hypothetical protein
VYVGPHHRPTASHRHLCTSYTGAVKRETAFDLSQARPKDSWRYTSLLASSSSIVEQPRELVAQEHSLALTTRSTRSTAHWRPSAPQPAAPQSGFDFAHKVLVGGLSLSRAILPATRASNPPATRLPTTCHRLCASQDRHQADNHARIAPRRNPDGAQTAGSSVVREELHADRGAPR